MIKAIVVDDENAVVSIIDHFIKKDSIPIEIVASADNGKDGIKLINEIKPQLVFIDIQMPLVNGFELMKQQPNYTYIVITAFESFEYAQEALRAGAKDIILKPIEYEQLITAISRAIGWKFTNNKIVNEILEYINDNYNRNISLSTLATFSHSSISHISRLFKDKMDISILSYINKIRIEKAMLLLESSDFSIKEVAYEVGYDSLNNFYKHFKKINNMTPAMYQKILKIN
ncbi:two-component system response regulator YesN [Bacilli bacterium PM5-9]|nr:two-component system response regulator YesN [Bacilli bacterium PM5-9]